MNCSVRNETLTNRHVLSMGDSSSFNLKKRLGRIEDKEELGVLQDGKTPGSFTHVNLAVDADTSPILGLADVLYWMRPKRVQKAPSQVLAPVKEKETYIWFMGASNS